MELNYEACLEWPKEEEISCQSLKVQIEALIKGSYIYCPDGLKNTLGSQDCVFGTVPTVETVGRAYIPKTGEWMRSLQQPRSARGSTGSHIILITKSNILFFLLSTTQNPDNYILNKERAKNKADSLETLGLKG